MSLDYTVNEINPTTVELLLGSIIDEKTILPLDYDFSEKQNLYIDFSKVVFLNSEGIKVWVGFSERMGSHCHLNIFYRKCNRMIIDQVNRTVGFLGSNAKILSVYVPVFCNTCEANFQVFQDVNKLTEEPRDILDRVKAPDCEKFPTCKKKWELDFSPRQFFKFLERK